MTSRVRHISVSWPARASPRRFTAGRTSPNADRLQSLYGRRPYWPNASAAGNDSLSRLRTLRPSRSSFGTLVKELHMTSNHKRRAHAQYIERGVNTLLREPSLEDRPWNRMATDTAAVNSLPLEPPWTLRRALPARRTRAAGLGHSTVGSSDVRSTVRRMRRRRRGLPQASS